MNGVDQGSSSAFSSKLREFGGSTAAAGGLSEGSVKVRNSAFPPREGGMIWVVGAEIKNLVPWGGVSPHCAPM